VKLLLVRGADVMLCTKQKEFLMDVLENQTNCDNQTGKTIRLLLANTTLSQVNDFIEKK
jgi:hypothetical protein